MKLTALLLFALCLQVQARSYGQSLTIHEDNAAIQKVFIHITKQTGIQFLYTESILKLAHPVTIHVVNGELDNVLKQCFNNQPLEYEMINGTVAVKWKREIPLPSKADSVPRISGKVTADGKPLEGVSVRIKNSDRGTLTNADGEFELFQAPEKTVLIFSSVGYQIKEEFVNGRLFLNVQLSIAVSNLDETVVIGYGTTTKRFNTGSVSKVGYKDIQQQPIANPLEALQGRIPGMFVTQQTGVPGGSFKVELRGRNSISNGTNPLYIVDGVPFISSSLSSNSLSSGITRQGSPLNSINPSDIESIEILKDADATAIYGSRAANGVVLITTRKGRAGKTNFEARIYKGIGKLGRRMDLLNTRQYLEMRHEAFANDEADPGSADFDVNGDWDSTRYTDWQKELLGNTAQITDAQANISGGNEITQFRAGGGYHKETTVFPGSLSDRRISAHLSLNNKSLNERFKTNITVSYVSGNNNLPQLDLTYTASNLAPNAPALYDANDRINWQNSTWTNPLSFLLQKYKSKTDNLIANAVISYNLLPSLELKTNLGYTKMSIDEMTLSPINSYKPSLNVNSGSAQFGNNSINTWIVEPQANWSRTFGSSQINVLAGMTFQQSILKGQTYNATGYTSDDLLENRLAAASLDVTADNFTAYRYNAAFGRISYNYKRKYLVNLTTRRDGSSRFGPENRFANFGSFGGAWIFSNEKFLQKNNSSLSYGKLRVSYGTTGSDQIPDYGYLDTYTPAYKPYQGITGLYPTNLYNPVYGWEANKKLEAALEVGLLKDRILFSAAYYKNVSSNQLVGYSLAPTTGFTSLPYYNLPAKVRNTGIELELNTVNIHSNTISWSTNFNVTFPENKLISYPDLANSTNANLYVIGEPLTIVKTFHVQGVNPQTGVVEIYDADSDGSLTAKDLRSIINIAQKYYGGFQNTFRFKELEISFLFQFVKQTGYNYFFNFSFAAPGFMGNQPVDALDRWQKPGDISENQKFSQSYGPTYVPYIYNSLLGDRIVADASFIRLKNLSLSYNMSGGWLKSLKINSCKVFLQSSNLLTISGYRGMDPETGMGKLPPSKILTAGIQVTL